MAARSCEVGAAQLGARFSKVAALMADAKPEVLAFAAFPRAHWQKIWSTNLLERVFGNLTGCCSVELL